jgi:RNA polymerase-binding transcription factor DksA
MTLTHLTNPDAEVSRHSFEHLEAELHAKAVRLVTVIAGLRDELATCGVDRQAVLHLIERCKAELGDISDALDRGRRGAYGTCEVCGGLISAQRLEAMPESRACVDCAAGPGRSWQRRPGKRAETTDVQEGRETMTSRHVQVASCVGTRQGASGT